MSKPNVRYDRKTKRIVIHQHFGDGGEYPLEDGVTGEEINRAEEMRGFAWGGMSFSVSSFNREQDHGGVKHREGVSIRGVRWW